MMMTSSNNVESQNATTLSSTVVAQQQPIISDAAKPDVKMTTVEKLKSKPKLLSGYLAFACICVTVGEHYSERDYSSMLTLSGGFQMLGLVLLRIWVEWQESVAGISAKAMMLHAAASLFRLTSTTWLSGYIPTDPTGDWVYQATDIVSLLAALSMIHAIYRRFRHTYDQEKDEMGPSFHTIFMSAIFVATAFHGDLNARPIFDMAWFTGFYLDCLAIMPQVCLLWHCARRSDIITSHYVWTMVLKVGMSYAFFFYAFSELGPEDCPDCVNYVGYALITMHSLQLIFVVALGALKLEKSLPEPDQKTAAKLGVPEELYKGTKIAVPPSPQASEVELGVRGTQAGTTAADLEAGAVPALKKVSI